MFADAEVDIIGAAGQHSERLREALDLAIVALASEQVGGADEREIGQRAALEGGPDSFHGLRSGAQDSSWNTCSHGWAVMKARSSARR